MLIFMDCQFLKFCQNVVIVCLFHQVLRDDVLTALWKTMVASGKKGAEEQTSRPKSPLMYTYHGKEYLGI